MGLKVIGCHEPPRKCEVCFSSCFGMINESQIKCNECKTIYQSVGPQFHFQEREVTPEELLKMAAKEDASLLKSVAGRLPVVGRLLKKHEQLEKENAELKAKLRER
jgi:hypothetical protein